jgi:hypothetical protein
MPYVELQVVALCNRMGVQHNGMIAAPTSVHGSPWQSSEIAGGAAGGPDCTVCTDGWVHQPVRDHHSERLTPTTKRYQAPREIRLIDTAVLLGLGGSASEQT